MNMKNIVLLAILSVMLLTIIFQAYHHWYYSIEYRMHVILRNVRRQARRETQRNSGLIFTAGPDPPSAPHGQLDPSVLASLPVLDYVVGSTTLECAVCISEFEVGEKVRLLPKCKHCFHVDCIDMWFSSHTTCPLCRSQVTLRILSLRRIVSIGGRSATVAPAAREEMSPEAAVLDLEFGLSESNHQQSRAQA